MSMFQQLIAIPKDPDYEAYLDYIRDTLVEPVPNQRVQIAQNKVIKDLKAAGLWTRMKTGYFFHSGSLAGACRVNIKNPATYLLTVVVTPFFFENMGTRASGSGYLDQPFKSDEYAGIETDLTAVECVSNYEEWDTVAVTKFASGMRMNAAGTASFALYPKYDTTQGFFYHSTGSVAFSNTTSHEGIYVLTYNGTQSVLYRDGTKTTATNTPTVPNISINRFILSYNNASSSGGSTPLTFYDRFVWADFLFDRFTDADELALRTILNNYKNSLGIGTGFAMDNGSNCWFANPMSLYHAGSNKSWIGQVHTGPTDAGGAYSQYIVQKNHTTGLLSFFRVGTFAEKDDHNEPSMLVRASDSRLFTVYTEHARVGSPIRWRISTNPTDSTAWGSENTIDPSAGTREYTYPSCFQATNGDIYVFYRGTTMVSAEWYYIKSTDNGVSFGAETLFLSNTYTNAYQDPNDKDIIHFICSPNPSEQPGLPATVSHFYYDAGANTWHKSDASTISLPVNDANATTIFSKTGSEEVWFEDLIVDSNGYPRALLIFYPNATTNPEIKHRYYTEWNGSAWSTPFDMGNSMNHSIGTLSLGVNLYTGGAAFDPANPDRIFSSWEVPGAITRMEMYLVERLTSSSFRFTQLTFDSDNYHWRPNVTSAPDHNVWWSDIIFYTNYLNYYQVLVNKTL